MAVATIAVIGHDPFTDPVDQLDTKAAYLRSDPIVVEFARSRANQTEVAQDLALGVYAFRDELENVAVHHAIAYRWLVSDGDPALPSLRPPTPIAEESERIQRELVTVEEARAWLLTLGIGG